VPFKVRLHVAEVVRDSLTGGTQTPAHEENLPRDLSFGREPVDGTQSESTEVAAERPSGEVLQNQSTEMAKEGVPLQPEGHQGGRRESSCVFVG
jgi:hypothetical protein